MKNFLEILKKVGEDIKKGYQFVKSTLDSGKKIATAIIMIILFKEILFSGIAFGTILLIIALLIALFALQAKETSV